ncbi:MAG: L-glyceraldehyde 3-phosphate reductase [bacterium]
MDGNERYDRMHYRRCGRSGISLPVISLGLWHNFGSVDPFGESRAMVRRAFDLGITHFDLANNYGPEPGSAEETFGRILRRDLATHRDELIISSKAGYRMWPGLYGDGGSRKYLIASLDQSLRRMGLDYVDIFYHHCPDSDTPLEESMLALEQIVRQGKALYVGISSYPPALTQEAVNMLRANRVPLIIHQPKYSMFDRSVEPELLGVLRAEGLGCIAFSPLAQGLLTNRYLRDIPSDSRVAKAHGALSVDAITDATRRQLVRLDAIARERGQSLAQLALVWVLRENVVTSAIIGASRVAQLEENVAALDNMTLSSTELAAIDEVLAER